MKCFLAHIHRLAICQLPAVYTYKMPQDFHNRSQRAGIVTSCYNGSPCSKGTGRGRLGAWPAQKSHENQVWIDKKVKETAEMAVKGVCMLLCFLAACFSAGNTYMLFEEDYTNSSNFMHRTSYPKVHTPRAWICLTTSGGKMLLNRSSLTVNFSILLL